MKKIVSCAVFALVAGIALADVTPIEASIAKGAKFLLANQQADGHFSDAQMPALTALPLWALSGCGDTSETVVEAKKKAAKFVLGTQRDDGGFYVPKPGRGGSGLGNYNTSVCLSALFDSKLAPTAPLLKAREYVASSQLTGDDTMAGGFGYDKISRRRYADLSNTSYALSAMAKTASLEEFREGGKRVDLDWDKALAFVENLMKKEGPDAGGAAYNDRTPQGGTETNAQGKVALRAYGAMTYAAVLSMCSAKLDKARHGQPGALLLLRHHDARARRGEDRQGWRSRLEEGAFDEDHCSSEGGRQLGQREQPLLGVGSCALHVVRASRAGAVSLKWLTMNQGRTFLIAVVRRSFSCVTTVSEGADPK